MRVQATLAACALGLACAALATEIAIRPGRWETTIQLDLAGKELPAGLPASAPAKSIDCITAEEAKQTIVPIEMPDASCVMSDLRQVGRTIHYLLACDDATVALEITLHSPDSYSGTATSRGKDHRDRMILKFAGKRLGNACSAQEQAADDAE